MLPVIVHPAALSCFRFHGDLHRSDQPNHMAAYVCICVRKTITVMLKKEQSGVATSAFSKRLFTLSPSSFFMNDAAKKQRNRLPLDAQRLCVVSLILVMSSHRSTFSLPSLSSLCFFLFHPPFFLIFQKKKVFPVLLFCFLSLSQTGFLLLHGS